eukprot:TRINITY_DN39688_c0_g1_i1.p1 TRINITY_DN39688_c0_g1~~TRINITY_DN39688_c0_g1_i1.p1  ORF type:complete len:178 (+),score=42.69 TRINITY_DN39688_c0_g1_i1:61-594(+)
MGGKDVLAGTTRFLGVLTALMAVTCGVIHVVRQFDKWCSKPDTCVGPALVWGEGDNFVHDLNGPPTAHKWRSVFTLVPDVFFDMWTAFFLGMVTLCGMHIKSTQAEAISGNWVRGLLWYTFLAFFGCFGYAGSFGIITGFVAVFTAFLCLVCELAHAPGGPAADVGGAARRGYSQLK